MRFLPGIGSECLSGYTKHETLQQIGGDVGRVGVQRAHLVTGGVHARSTTRVARYVTRPSVDSHVGGASANGEPACEESGSVRVVG